MMTNTPLAHPEDLKLLLREGIEKLCPPGIVAREYNALQFATATGELGTQGRYLLVGLCTLSQTHLRPRDILLPQPKAVHESYIQTLPWVAPPFQTPTVSDVMETPRDQRTPDEIATYLKARFRPKVQLGKRAAEVRWTTTCLTTEPSEESIPKYAD